MPSQQSQNSNRCNGDCHDKNCDFCQITNTFNPLPMNEDITWVSIDFIANENEQEHENSDSYKNEHCQEEIEEIKQQFQNCSCCQGNVFECSATVCQSLGYCHCYANYQQQENNEEFEYEQEEQEEYEDIYNDYQEMYEMEEFHQYLQQPQAAH